MRYLLLVAALFVFLVVPTVTHRFARRRVEERVQQIMGWERLPDPADRERCIFEYMRQNARVEALRWVTSASMIIAGLTFAALSLWLIYDVAAESHDTADDVQVLAGENCRLYEQFLSDEADDTDREIRALTADISDLQEEIETEPSDIRQIPGYTNLGPSVRRFLQNLLQAQIADAQEQLADWNAELEMLRNREDQLSRQLEDANCPRAE